MREVELQSLIVAAFRENGGAGQKLSNKFLAGVVDLLLKHPEYEAAVMEVKIAHFVKSGSDSHVFKLDVTELQRDFLRKFDRAGMPTGVISGVTRGSRLYLACFSLDEVERSDYTAIVGQHTDMGQGAAKTTAIFKHIGQFLSTRVTT